jgi:hypothetical protein
MTPESLNKPWPLGLLLFGLLMLLLAVIGTFTGKAYGRGGSVARAEDPLDYWGTLILQYVGGACLIRYWYVLPH